MQLKHTMNGFNFLGIFRYILSIAHLVETNLTSIFIRYIQDLFFILSWNIIYSLLLYHLNKTIIVNVIQRERVNYIYTKEYQNIISNKKLLIYSKEKRRLKIFRINQYCMQYFLKTVIILILNYIRMKYIRNINYGRHIRH